MPDTDRIAELERRLRAARDRIQVLEHALGCTADAQPVPGLSPTERQILGMLRAAPVLSNERAVLALYGTRPDCERPVDEEQILQVNVCKIRRKLKPFGLGIETVRGAGYRLPPETKRRLDEMGRP